MTDRLDVMARRLRGDRFFLASALEDFARSAGLDRFGLAEVLGCEQETLGPLGLCRRPDPAGESFAADVDLIARRFALRPDALLEVLRRADALAALRALRPAADGRLAAARDRRGRGGNRGGGGERR